MILVTGATGNVGRQVITQLLAKRHGTEVRAMTRSPETAGLPAGIEVVRGDHSDPADLDANLAGVEAVFLVWPFATAEAASAVVDVIAGHARRVVLLSSSAVRDDVDRHTGPVAQLHAGLERPIERSGLEWTFLRPWGFAANALAWAPQIRETGIVRDIHGMAAMTMIHERDVAAVAVRALTEDGHGGAKYELTGPELLTQIQQVEIIGEVIGRTLRWQEISRQDARRRYLAAGMPPSDADFFLDAYAGMITEPGGLTSTVQQVTGTPAAPFRQWVIDHAADFR